MGCTVKRVCEDNSYLKERETLRARMFNTQETVIWQPILRNKQTNT